MIDQVEARAISTAINQSNEIWASVKNNRGSKENSGEHQIQERKVNLEMKVLM